MISNVTCFFFSPHFIQQLVRAACEKRRLLRCVLGFGEHSIEILKAGSAASAESLIKAIMKALRKDTYKILRVYCPCWHCRTWTWAMMKSKSLELSKPVWSTSEVAFTCFCNPFQKTMILVSILITCESPWATSQQLYMMDFHSTFSLRLNWGFCKMALLLRIEFDTKGCALLCVHVWAYGVYISVSSKWLQWICPFAYRPQEAALSTTTSDWGLSCKHADSLSYTVEWLSPYLGHVKAKLSQATLHAHSFLTSPLFIQKWNKVRFADRTVERAGFSKLYKRKLRRVIIAFAFRFFQCLFFSVWAFC